MFLASKGPHPHPMMIARGHPTFAGPRHPVMIARAPRPTVNAGPKFAAVGPHGSGKICGAKGACG